MDMYATSTPRPISGKCPVLGSVNWDQEFRSLPVEETWTLIKTKLITAVDEFIP